MWVPALVESGNVPSFAVYISMLRKQGLPPLSTLEQVFQGQPLDPALIACVVIAIGHSSANFVIVQAHHLHKPRHILVVPPVPVPHIVRPYGCPSTDGK